MTTNIDAETLRGLATDLRTHAFDDCGERDIPTHIANIAADAILALLDENARLKAERDEALRRCERLREALQADPTEFPDMEAKLVEIANRISGMRGQPPCHPDPVMLSEWVSEINRAALEGDER